MLLGLSPGTSQRGSLGGLIRGGRNALNRGEGPPAWTAEAVTTAWHEYVSGIHRRRLGRIATYRTVSFASTRIPSASPPASSTTHLP